MSERWLTAAFFVARENSAPTVEELATRAGVLGGRRGVGSEFEASHMHGQWAGLAVRVGLVRMQLHDCLRILIRQQDFFALRSAELPIDLPLSADPCLPLATAFRDACLALPAEVGLFITHLGPADADPADGLYHHVLGRDAAALAQSFPGLLYLDERMSAGFQHSSNRDTLPVDHGVLLFAGCGPARWY